MLWLAAGCGPWPSDGAFKSEVFSEVHVLGSRGNAPGQFVKPRSIAVDRDDNVYVCDMTGRVQKFDPDGNYLLQWQMPEITRGRPKGMACDHEGNIVVVEPHYSRINHFTPEGRLVSQWGVHGRESGQLSFPRAVAVGADGSAYVSEFQIVERVQRFRPDRQAVLFEVRGAGHATGQFNRAEGLSLSPSGELFVADSCNHRVQVFRTDGTFVREFGRAGSERGEFSYPYDVRVDEQGRQYICEFGNSRLTVLDSEGEVLAESPGAKIHTPPSGGGGSSFKFEVLSRLRLGQAGLGAARERLEVRTKAAGTAALQNAGANDATPPIARERVFLRVIFRKKICAPQKA